MNRKTLLGEKVKYFVLLISLVAFTVKTTSATRAAGLENLDSQNLETDQNAGIDINDLVGAANVGAILAPQIGSVKLEDANTDQGGADSPVVQNPENPDTQPAALSPDAFKDLESKGALKSGAQPEENNPTVFNLASKFLARVVFHSDAEFQKRPKFDNGMEIAGAPTFDKDTAGYAIIKKGNQSVVVDFDQEYDSPPIVTATLSLQQYKDPDVRAVAEDLLLISDVKYIVTDVTKNGFQIMMDRSADSDIPFSWHALAVDNPQTFKKAGDTTKNDQLPSDNYIAPSDNKPKNSNAPSGSLGPQAIDQSIKTGGSFGQDNSNNNNNNSANNNSATK